MKPGPIDRVMTEASRALRCWCPALLFAGATALASCGGGDHGSSGTPPDPPRGTLLGAPHLVSTVSAADLLQQLGAPANAQLLLLAGSPVCDIRVYHIEYETVGGKGEATTASAALMVPSGAGTDCHGGRPIVLYAHGTTTDRGFDISNLQDSANAEGLLMAAFFASQGDIVVAPNYAGYDTSTLTYHPYLVGDQQSKDMIDALTAARRAIPAGLLLAADGGELFITGYSQGGYVAMATQRAMQAAGMTVTAAAPMSGPYAIAAFVDAVFGGEVNAGAPVFSTLMITAYQKSHGDIYQDTTDIFEAQYASGIDSLLPGTEPRSQLYAEGKLPQYALFSAMPPDPAYAAMTPATTPANLAPVFAAGFGDGNLITNAYRLDYLQDAVAHPDGGWPTLTTGVAAAAPASPLRAALKDNDLRDWMPTAPTLLCGGDGDPTVLWLNAELMQDYWAQQAPASPLVAVLDVDAAITANDPYADYKNGFAAAKLLVEAAAVAQGATDGGAAAVAAAYHSTLVPPFCLVAVRAFFSAHQ